MLLSVVMSFCLFFNDVNRDATITLTDGRKLIGTIVSRTNTQIMFKRKGVTMTLAVNRIRSIKYKKMNESSKTTKSSMPEKSTVERPQSSKGKTQSSTKPDTTQKNTKPGAKSNPKEEGDDGDESIPEKKVVIEETDDDSKLIAAAMKGGEEEVKALVDGLGKRLVPVLKKKIKRPTAETSKLMLSIVKNGVDKADEKNIWLWFFKYTRKEHLDEGLEILKKKEDKTESLNVCILSLIYDNPSAAQRLQNAIDSLFKDISRKQYSQFKELIKKRSVVSPKYNAKYCYTLFKRLYDEPDGADWKFFITHRSMDIRMMAMSHAIVKKVKKFDKSILEELYMKSKMVSEKELILKFMDTLNIFINKPGSEFLSQLLKDARQTDRKKRLLSHYAYRRLKKDTGKNFPVNSPTWKEYFSNR